MNTARFLPSALRSRAGLRRGAAALASALALACHSGDAAKAPPAAPSAAAPNQAAATSTSGQTAAVAGANAATAPSPSGSLGTAAPAAGSIHGLTMKRLDGTDGPLSAWAGKVVLVVNTASKCGYTPQYKGLQELHAKYADRGFAVLGFPSNDFGGQEPGSSQEIATFCTSMYSVNFPMFEKVVTKGEGRAPLYTLLTDALGAPQWNFHKYLVDKQGRPVRAWPSKVEPLSAEVTSAIEAQLQLP